MPSDPRVSTFVSETPASLRARLWLIDTYKAAGVETEHVYDDNGIGWLLVRVIGGTNPLAWFVISPTGRVWQRAVFSEDPTARIEPPIRDADYA